MRVLYDNDKNVESQKLLLFNTGKSTGDGRDYILINKDACDLGDSEALALPHMGDLASNSSGSVDGV